LHDIGKIGVPPPILKREIDSLTNQERSLLRQHVTHGESIIQMVPNCEEAARFVRHHRERWNGTGYPDQLSAIQIPLGARIIAVADYYDKMLNGRTDLCQITPQAAFAHVAEKAGSWFDVDVVSALERLLNDAQETHAHWANEIEISPKDLQVGMKLAEDLFNNQGLLLLPAESVLDANLLQRLSEIYRDEPIATAIHVYRNRQDEAPLSPTVSA